MPDNDHSSSVGAASRWRRWYMAIRQFRQWYCAKLLEKPGNTTILGIEISVVTFGISLTVGTCWYHFQNKAADVSDKTAENRHTELRQDLSKIGTEVSEIRSVVVVRSSPSTSRAIPKMPLPQAEAPSAQNPGDICDSLVSNLDDIRRTSAREGASDRIRNPAAAAEACAEAEISNPTEPRLRYQRGLALEAAGDRDKAYQEFQEAEDEGYPPALSRHARLLFSGTDSQKREAIRLFFKAQYGSADAMYWIGHFEYTGTYKEYGINPDRNGKNKIVTAALFGSDTARRDPVSEYRPR